MGMSYRVQGESAERSWPLGRVPLLISQDDWREIARGVEQRAELFERVLGDLYGEGALVREGLLPAAAVTGSTDFLASMRGVAPPGKRWLRLYAADIGRGPDGRWWVLGDRTQAPSGSGYALENRLVVSQAFPSLYSEMNVERLAPFFREFRAGLRTSAQRSGPRICILTPGPWSQTYFEQAYLARYLGFLLVEGGDLVMREGHIYVRTIAGLKRADVLWRHVDADWCDPVELNPASRIGVPGLIDAIRAGGVAVENMPGSGLLESRALLAFMPGLARRLLGADLVMPSIATWWCGQQAERDEVLASLDEIAVAGAFGDRVPGFGDQRTIIGAELSSDDRRRLAQDIGARGVDYVGQDIVRLSTTPRWENGQLVPRPFVLRVYAAATPDGWRVMPGGFCRVSGQSDARAVSMGEGVELADVWVLSDSPVETTSLLPAPEKTRIVRLLGNLPSRAADNLFWFGRYLEREEATLRLVRCICSRAVDPDTPANSARQSLDRLKALLVAWGAVPPEMAKESSALASETALRDDESNGSALSIARAARHAASVIRERLTPQTWRLIGRLEIGDRRGARSCARRARDHRLHGRRADHDRRSFRSFRRELQPRRRMDILRRRAAHRAGHQHLPADAAIRRPGGERPQSRRSARPDRFADHLSLALPDRRRARAGARHGAARSVQSALRRISGRLDRRPYREPADPAPGRHARGAAAPVDAIARRTCDAGRREDR